MSSNQKIKDACFMDQESCEMQHAMKHREVFVQLFWKLINMMLRNTIRSQRQQGQ